MSTFEPVVRIPDPELLLRAPTRPGGYTDGGLAKTQDGGMAKKEQQLMD
jgi:hypothetical protein